ncbi:MAG: bifunctional riboflavin kinase/FAD synthetase [Acidobacteria bacterium]|nr:bifunctional riboflavin kinase/FAD synthetase [Acidobacteriota bacterium]
MKICHDIESCELKTPTIVTFGVFDGLHLGHQTIMKQVVERAKATGLAATVVTFDPHPRAVLHPESAPPLLHTFEQKMEAIARLGIEQVVVLTFTKELAEESAEEFLLQTIFGRLDAREVYLGKGFAFGNRREGNFELLKAVADKLQRLADEVPEVMLRGRRVSSTAIRKLLNDGRINVARRMLGRPYGVESRVIEGHKVGREKLTYATANLKPHNRVLPAKGVYITLTLVEGEWRRSLTNIGVRPTFGGDAEVSVETHLMNFDREIYGEKIRVRFLHRLRGEKKFESIEALKAQIDKDYKRAVRYFDRAAVKRNIRFV